MTILYLIALVAIVFALFAAVGPEGLWHNLITLVNVTFAALVATNAFEPIAARIHYAWPKIGFFIDFIMLWLVFAVTFALLQIVTSRASKIKVQVGTKTDQIGGFVLATLTGWVVVCFTAMTLHTAPIPREALGNAMLPQSVSGPFAVVAPDRVWLNTAQRLSIGSCLGGGDTQEPTFDPAGEFILEYGTRRYNNYRHEAGLFSNRQWGAAVPFTEDVPSP